MMLCVQAQRDLLLRDVAGFVALEQGVGIDAGDLAPDLTTAPLVAALAAGDPTAELLAAPSCWAMARTVSLSAPR